MGLGKTLMFISLIADSKINRKERGPTLIVCPLSIIQVWNNQIQAHIDPIYSLSVITYHGANRRQLDDQLEKYDVILSTYGTVSNEKEKSKLMTMKFQRVVLDEGHHIKNPLSLSHKSVCLLNAKYR